MLLRPPRLDDRHQSAAAVVGAAESHLEGGKSNAKVSARAHVDFRIVIPKVLSVGLADGDTQSPGAQRVAIFSNSRNVTLAASTVRRPPRATT